MSVLDTTDVLDVAGYAAAVRRSLADLGPEQVDDLTDDLEADLAEALDDERHVAHGRGVLEQFGPPVEYAAELRAAAGLAPAAAPTGRVRLFGDPVEDTRRLGRWALGRLRAQAWWAPVEAFLIALRPAWWLLRGWVVYQLVALVLGVSGWLPRNLAAFLVLVGAVVLSVQYGRGEWFRSRRVTWLAVTANVVAVLAVLPLLAGAHDRVAASESVYADYTAGRLSGGGGTQTIIQDKAVDGVVVDGMQVSNLFVYDAEGNPLSDVQVYDDRGRPVRTTFDNGFDQYWFPEATEPWSFVSRVDSDGRARWNVYPLQGAPTSEFTYDDDGLQVLPAGSSATTPPWPFAKAPALDAAPEATIGAEGPAPTPTSTP
ncbi:HAAS signaling domain-containing protein [Cellulomonas xylanilytica]|uniref:Uncharacterized protein n=1 Tax=Cellulomonas xylanilytica TaxID=233583 RepID=A0A510V331_9CELL|nr:cytochrome d ubiquinol oxidase subunit II [Cellulomonas xylanilytica]GEK21293.1 hypothetical protein CXY01_18130 [Cellulomonas xylanilytica]